MGRVNDYLLKQFSSIFASLFFTLFFITSIIFFIKIASITSVIKITFIELGTLYIYLLPNIIIYTVPITFFIAVCISLFNLSKENEIIILFTLGYSPKKITKLFLITASILSVILIVNIVVLIPIAKQLNKNFIDYKKTEAKFNIKPTEFGQKFSNWLVYINKGDKQDNFDSIVMYQEANNHELEKFIIANKAKIENKDGFLSLKLNKGKAFQFKTDSIEQLNFDNMYINTQPKTSLKKIQTIKEYWLSAINDKKRAYDLAFFLMIALFPISTILLSISIGIVTYRYEKGGIYLSMASVILIYLLCGFMIVKYFNIIGLLFFIPTYTLFSYAFYKKRILKRY